MRDILDFAFAYRERGWAVIPAVGKQPAVAWACYQRKIPTAEQIRKWFAVRGQHNNLAIITGRHSGLVVVDCDSGEDAEWWQSCFPRTPMVVNTGGGGKHFYYRYPSSHVSCRTRVFGRRVDLRADGGLVIAPPSIHPKTRQTYQWCNGFPRAPEDIPLFEARWVADSMHDETARRSHAFPDNTSIRNGLAYIRRIKAIAGNGGHNATFRAACKLRDSGLTAGEALETLLHWNETNASPPWSEKELEHKVDDAYRND